MTDLKKEPLTYNSSLKWQLYQSRVTIFGMIDNCLAFLMIAMFCGHMNTFCDSFCHIPAKNTHYIIWIQTFDYVILLTSCDLFNDHCKNGPKTKTSNVSAVDLQLQRLTTKNSRLN